MAYSQIPHTLCFAKEVHDLEGVLGVGGEISYSKVKQGPEFNFYSHIKSWMWGHALTITSPERWL